MCFYVRQILCFSIVIIFASVVTIDIRQNTTLINILLQDQSNSTDVCFRQAASIRSALCNPNSNLTNITVPRYAVTYENITFLLFTRNFSGPQKLVISKQEASIRSSSFDVNKQTVLFIDGYNISASRSEKILPKTILSANDFNLIIVNWDSYINFNGSYTGNITLPGIGGIVADFVHQLMNVGANPKKMYFIGFSAGGEISALAAKRIKPRISRLLALEPQGNCYNSQPPTKRIDKSDADFVVIAHCAVSLFSLPLDILGDVTFYVNGGYVQNECLYYNTTEGSDQIYNISKCSHEACATYFFNSTTNFGQAIGIRCRNYGEYLQQRCDCFDTITFGYYTPSNARGLYFVDDDVYYSSRNNPACLNYPFDMMDNNLAIKPHITNNISDDSSHLLVT